MKMVASRSGHGWGRFASGAPLGCRPYKLKGNARPLTHPSADIGDIEPACSWSFLGRYCARGKRYIAAADGAVEQALHRGQPPSTAVPNGRQNSGRLRSSRNSVPSVRPWDSGPGASPGRSFPCRRGTPPRSLMHLRPSCFRQGAGIRVRE